MKTEIPKQTCPICHEQVTTSPLGWSQHQKKHERENAEMNKDVSDSKTEAVKIPVSASGVTSQPKSAEAARMLEIALKAQEEMRKAPDVFIRSQDVDVNTKLVQQYAPDAMDRYRDMGRTLVYKAPRHAFFCSAHELGLYAARGYVPVINGSGEYVRNNGGDILTTCDRDYHERRVEAAQRESRARLKSSQVTNGTKSTAPGMAKAKPGDVKTEELTIERSSDI